MDDNRPGWVGIAIRYPDGRVTAVEIAGEDLDLPECLITMDAEVDRDIWTGRVLGVDQLFRFIVAARRWRMWLAGADAAQQTREPAALTAAGVDALPEREASDE